VSAIKAPALMIFDEYDTLDVARRRPGRRGGPPVSMSDPRTLMVSHISSRTAGPSGATQAGFLASDVTR